MRMRQLECFVRVCELGSLTRAAEQLNIAQPALGLQIRGLEDEFGVPLLVRHSRGVQATGSGNLLLEEARAVLRNMRELRAKLTEAAGAQTATLGLSPNMTALLAIPLLAAASAELPKLRLRLVEDLSNVLVGWVRSDELDLALAYDVAENDRLDRSPILREGLVFIEPPDGGNKGPITLADALRCTLAIPGLKDSVRCAVELEARRLDRPVIVQYEIQSVTVIKELVRSGLANAILPLGTVHREVEAGELAYRQIVDPSLSRVLYLIRAAGRTASMAEECLVAVLRRTLDAMIAENGLYGACVTPLDHP